MVSLSYQKPRKLKKECDDVVRHNKIKKQETGLWKTQFRDGPYYLESYWKGTVDGLYQK